MITHMRWCLMPLLVLIACGGCSKKKEPTVADFNEVKTNLNAAPIQGTVDPAMTARLKKFIQMRGKMPQSFLEMSAATGDSVPRPQEGFAYIIDPVTQEVKVVKAQ